MVSCRTKDNNIFTPTHAVTRSGYSFLRKFGTYANIDYCNCMVSFTIDIAIYAFTEPFSVPLDKEEGTIGQLIFVK